MSDPPERPERLQERAEELLAMTARCYRLAAGITDRKTVQRLLEMARECEERAAAISMTSKREF